MASRKLRELHNSIQQLAETPHIGSIRNELYPGLRVIPSAGKGVICFRVDDARQVVFIVSITYARADWVKRVAERSR